MDKEKEIARMSKAIYETGIAIDGTDIAFGLIDDSHFERMARKLVAEGYGDVRAAVKEFANDLQNAIVINELIRNKDERMVVLAEIEELGRRYAVMNNEELKKKIEGILQEEIEYVVVCGSSVKNVCIEHIADALIAAGIGDVKKAERRVARAERAVNKFAENITCEDCPFFSDCASSEKMEDLIHSNYCFAEYLRQAEKELAEDIKNGELE